MEAVLLYLTGACFVVTAILALKYGFAQVELFRRGHHLVILGPASLVYFVALRLSSVTVSKLSFFLVPLGVVVSVVAVVLLRPARVRALGDSVKGPS